MQKLNKFMLSGFLSIGLFGAAHAGQGHYLTIKNDSNSDYQIHYDSKDCWYPNDLAKNVTIKKHSKKRLYSEEEESFFSCAGKPKNVKFYIQNTDGSNKRWFQYLLKFAYGSPFLSLNDLTEHQHILTDDHGHSKQEYEYIYIDHNGDYTMAADDHGISESQGNIPHDYRYTTDKKTTNQHAKIIIHNALSNAVSVTKIQHLCPTDQAGSANLAPCIKVDDANKVINKLVYPSSDLNINMGMNISKTFNGYTPKDPEGFAYPMIALTLKNSSNGKTCQIQLTGQYKSNNHDAKKAQFAPINMLSSGQFFYRVSAGKGAALAHDGYLQMFVGSNYISFIDLSKPDNDKVNIVLTQCGEKDFGLTLLNNSNQTLFDIQSAKGAQYFVDDGFLSDGTLKPYVPHLLEAKHKKLPASLSIKFKDNVNESKYTVSLKNTTNNTPECQVKPADVWSCNIRKTNAGETIVLSKI